MTIVYCELNIVNQNAINEKAKTKADGVYTFRGIAYLVKRNRVEYFACGGEIIAQFGHFNTVVGTYQDRYRDGAMKALKERM
jgi:predicted glycoside hydrolase/deacetylase ChbG (UPF0249 family)